MGDEECLKSDAEVETLRQIHLELSLVGVPDSMSGKQQGREVEQDQRRLLFSKRKKR